MFLNRTHLITSNPPQLNYGIAVTDIDGDGLFEVFVTGFGFPNRIFKWNGTQFIDVAPPVLIDATQRAIGVAACDIDGDGLEEIYILNTDTFGGAKQRGDRLFDYVEGRWVDLFSLWQYQELVNLVAGRSVTGVDRTGRGLYGFFVANYGGPMRFYELDDDGVLHDVAPELGMNRITGGRSVIALPLVSDHMDIFVGTEQDSNYLFRNRGDGTYEEVAEQMGISDPFEHVRGVAALDANSDGHFDLVYGNWQGKHRLYVQTPLGRFQDISTLEMAAPSKIRNVLVADFDNDGYEEIFFNNIEEPNRLFGLREWKMLDPGDALEPHGLGTGAAIGDFDGDGRLELVIAHGEMGMQPLTLYHTAYNGNNWLRIFPQTAYGAPARGAVVTLKTASRTQKRVIDSGSAYLCQMEPVAHFGLGQETQVESVEVRWLDGTVLTLDQPTINQQIIVAYPHSHQFNFDEGF